uniref:Uncharacterized protein n=1 Tax=Chrysotila carterae TaxID=13221 RepID=A0A7S4F5S8_CHRCT
MPLGHTARFPYRYQFYVATCDDAMRRLTQASMMSKRHSAGLSFYRWVTCRSEGVRATPQLTTAGVRVGVFSVSVVVSEGSGGSDASSLSIDGVSIDSMRCSVSALRVTTSHAAEWRGGLV